MSWRQPRWTLLLALPLAAACGGGDAAVPDEPGPGDRVAAVETITAEAEEVVERAVFSADLLPKRRATLAAEGSGVVEEVTAELGDRVRAGQVLIRIDTRALRQQLAEAEALWRQAQDRYERAEALFEKRSITRERQIDALAERDVAEARLASARLALEKSEVKVPWGGRVADRRVEVGDYAAPGQPLVELVQVDRLKVRAPAPASDVPFLRIGAPVSVRVDALPGESFPGEVVRLGAELDPETRTLDVEAEIDNRDERLRPGLFGKMEVDRQTFSAALLVPLAALVDFERDRVLYVVEEGRARRRPVETGAVVGDRVLILSGLEPGDRVIVGGQQQVADGQRVSEAEGV